MAALNLPLSGIRVLDFTTLLPGPLATLALADAGATVIKVERPGSGELGRANTPRHGNESIQFALLNRGKKSLAIDLKSPDGKALALRLATEADVLVEQFRPGVMARLGLGYDELARLNRQLIYCSISGYGQTGPMAQVAAHDLNYVAKAGMLALSAEPDGRPCLPAGAVADVGGGSYPAVINIVMALFQRQRTLQGCYLDIAMSENVLNWMPRAIAPALVGVRPAEPQRGRHTGGSPRYGVYRTRDGKYLAVCPLEQQFWDRFCELIGLEATLRDDSKDPAATRARVIEILESRNESYWLERFEGEDVCVSGIHTVADAVTDPHYTQRSVWERKVRMPDGHVLPALPSMLVRAFTDDGYRPSPALGSLESNDPDPWQPPAV
jgi:crotonobetainyl-CoA:carnitine CoA-transferase CaiB-like acyl-CoA transferase